MEANEGKGFAYPKVLSATGTAAAQLTNPAVRFVEVSVNTSTDNAGHLPGAVGWNWTTDAQDLVRRDIPDKKTFERLMSRSGIANDTSVVLYSADSNWLAACAFWLLKIYNHADVRLLDGGRVKWKAEGRPMTADPPRVALACYRAGEPVAELRAYREAVLASLNDPASALVDVRSPAEYRGELIAPPHLPQEGAQRAGHIPGAVNISWWNALAEDGTFKSYEALTDLYGSREITPDKKIITYCRNGDRASHTWFVLKYLMGYPDVRNYDGSWIEWGSSIGVPIENPAAG